VSTGPLARLSAPANNPYGFIPRVTFGSLQSNAQSVPSLSFDTRLPFTGQDMAMPITDNLTKIRGSHIFKFGALREQEATRQARASNFSGQFD